MTEKPFALQTLSERFADVRKRIEIAARRSNRWRSKLGCEDSVLVDRPGRGYGDDYSPWLVDGPVGELVRTRAVAVSKEGILAA